jgi:putative NADPH-quinone reductase
VVVLPGHVEGLDRPGLVGGLGLHLHARALQGPVARCSAATGVATYRKYGYDAAMKVQIETGILGYCGITRCVAHIFHDVDSDADARRVHLIRAREIGFEFLPRTGAAKGHA